MRDEDCQSLRQRKGEREEGTAVSCRKSGNLRDHTEAEGKVVSRLEAKRRTDAVTVPFIPQHTPPLPLSLPLNRHTDNANAECDNARVFINGRKWKRKGKIRRRCRRSDGQVDKLLESE